MSSMDETATTSSSTPTSSSPPSKSSPPPPTKSSDSSPPPPDSSDSSPPPPDSSDSSPPPPDSSDSSPPPPDSSDSSPPPPSESSSPPPPKSSSPPPPDSSDSTPPPSKSPPPPSGSNDDNSSPPPPPPPSSDLNSPPPPWKPPPPPHSSSQRKSPPPPIPSSDGDYSSSHNKSPSPLGSMDNSKFIIAGAATAGGLLLILFLIVCVACIRKKKKRPQMVYYRDNSNGKKSSEFYNSSQPQNWKGNGDHAIHIPPSVAITPSHVSSEQWPAVPPPPPPAMSSTNLSLARSSGPPKPPSPPTFSIGYNQSKFTPEDLALATGGFSKANLLGQGGFGYVHKGVLPNGKEVAVKCLKAGSGQGEREFQAEVEMLSRVHHRHLVSLVGYCIADEQRMLVYEFIPNNSLEFHLHGEGQPVIDFPSRMKIALGSAKGFAYLHEDCNPRIIHRDIKAANILLDFDYEAKVADFGLAKLSNDNYTHVSTRIMGTFGYMAPEYASSGKLTEKSDVYSYGIVLLELISGKRPVEAHSDEDSLIDWAEPILEEAVDGGDFEELVDPRLNGEYDPHEMLRMIACAAACIRHSAKRRPRMMQIARALEGDASLEVLNEGMKKSSSAVFSSSSEFDGSYNGDMKRFKNHQHSASQDFTSGELGSTGECFTIHPSPLRSIGDSQEYMRKLKL